MICGSDFINVTGSGTAADPYVVAIEEGAANSMLITDANGDLEWATIESIVQSNETITTLVESNGIYTYTSEDNTVTVIDIPASVVENFETIVNDGPVTVNGETFNTVEEYITHIANESVTIGGSDFINVTGSGTAADPYVVAIEEGAANSMLITDANGDLEWATIESIVQSNETITTLVESNGIYTYTSEDNTVTVIDIPASVVENFETIVNDGPVTVNGETFNTVEEYITHIANESVTIGGSDFINVTGSGTAADPYVVAIEEGAANSMLITDANGDLEWATIESIVQSNETITTLVESNGIYTYTSEDNTVTVIDIPASVVENFETIVNDGPVTVNGETFNTVEEYITHIANESVTIGGSDFINVTGSGTAADPYVVAIEEGAANSMLITDANGDLEWATIESIVQSNETITTLVESNGIYTYTSEDNTVTVIDIPASVVENFETIVNDGPVTVNGETFNTVEEYITHIANESVTIGGSDFINVTGSGTAADPYVVAIDDGSANSMLITDANGDLEWATIESIVQANETVTVLVANADGTYTYTNEAGADVIIDIPASVVDQFENIYNQIVNEEITVNGDLYSSFEEYLTQIVTNNSNFEDNDFITVTGTGTVTDPYKITIVEGDDNSMLITNDAGELEWATIDDIVKGNETVTVLVKNTDGTYTYTNEENDDVIIDVPSSVVEQFENIYNQIVNEEITVDGDTYNSFEEYLTQIVTNNTNFEDNDFVEVIGDGTESSPYEITIKEGDDNSMLITNAAGELEWATIESIVNCNIDAYGITTEGIIKG